MALHKVLLRLGMAENWKFLMIMQVSVKLFVGYKKNLFMTLHKQGFILDQCD
jgi:hypothetical protein